MTPVGSEQVVIVTGQNCFNYMKIEENMRSINMIYDSIEAAGGDNTISEDFTCHVWVKEPSLRVVVAAANG